jgi:hypothetical protein
MAHINSWKIFVGPTATGKTRYAGLLTSNQAHEVQIFEELGRYDEDHFDEVLSNVRLDVEEVVLVTNFPSVARVATNMIRETYYVEPDVWLFARQSDVVSHMQDLVGLAVMKVMIPEDKRNLDGLWQEIHTDLIND